MAGGSSAVPYQFWDLSIIFGDVFELCSSAVADNMGYCPFEFAIEMCLIPNWLSMLIKFELLCIKCGERIGMLPLDTCHQHVLLQG